MWLQWQEAGLDVGTIWIIEKHDRSVGSSKITGKDSNSTEKRIEITRKTVRYRRSSNDRPNTDDDEKEGKEMNGRERERGEVNF